MKVTSLSPAERNHAILWVVVVVVNFLTVLVNYVKLYAEFFVFLSEWSTCLFAYRTDKWDPIASSYSRCRSRLVSKPRCKAVHLWSDHSGRMVIPRLSGLSVLSLASFTPFCHGVMMAMQSLRGRVCWQRKQQEFCSEILWIWGI